VAGFTLVELRAVMAECLPETASTVTETDLDTPLADLGCDFLVKVELATLIEDRHGVHVSNGDLPRMSTPRALISYVDTRLPATSGC
jgi:acyl carrier protein